MMEEVKVVFECIHDEWKIPNARENSCRGLSRGPKWFACSSLLLWRYATGYLVALPRATLEEHFSAPVQVLFRSENEISAGALPFTPWRIQRET